MLIVCDKIKNYLRLCIQQHCDSLAEDELAIVAEQRDVYWDTMTQNERDLANELVDLALGDRL